MDNGLITAKAVQYSPDTGKLMENLVFTELVKRGNQPSREFFYYKTRNDREIDFVIKNGYQVVELMQVCYDLINPDVEQRETKALFEASGELSTMGGFASGGKGPILTVLTWDEKREVKKWEHYTA